MKCINPSLKIPNETSELARTEDNSSNRDVVQKQSPAAENENDNEFAANEFR